MSDRVDMSTTYRRSLWNDVMTGKKSDKPGHAKTVRKFKLTILAVRREGGPWRPRGHQNGRQNEDGVYRVGIL